MSGIPNLPDIGPHSSIKNNELRKNPGMAPRILK
jgi:hypothetical protein